jgi:hypothetical protein
LINASGAVLDAHKCGVIEIGATNILKRIGSASGPNQDIEAENIPVEIIRTDLVLDEKPMRVCVTGCIGIIDIKIALIQELY